jgi:DNA-directed RNA polymerase specialized sigma24 family protein
MDVRVRRSESAEPNGRRGGLLTLPRVPGAGPGLSSEQVGQALGEWQERELLVASRFPECRGLVAEQLEDIYQETTEMLLGRRFHNEEHLRNSLYAGIKHRARHLYRDERRRDAILQERGARLHVADGDTDQVTPERAALLKEDRWIVAEFAAELSEDERRVFGWLAEGMKYRGIAAALGWEVNRARNAARSCERKREQFQLLHDTGRLCGFRAATIHAMQAGEATSDELAARAFAHLEGCAHCRAEHRTNARRLRRTFQGQAAALLPFPAIVGRLGWLSRAALRARMLQHRLMPDGSPIGPGGARERAAALLAGSGAAAKVAATVATVAVIAGGTVVATSGQSHTAPRRSHPTPASAAPAARPNTTVSHPTATRLVSPTKPRRAAAHRTGRRGRFAPGHAVIRHPRPSPATSASAQREPGGFAYLGVPTTSSAPIQPAHTARASGGQSGGGPFSP